MTTFLMNWGAVTMKSTNKKPYIKTYYKVKKDSAFYREKCSKTCFKNYIKVQNDPIYIFENELFTGTELERLRKRGYAIHMKLLERVEHRPCDTVKFFGARWLKKYMGV